MAQHDIFHGPGGLIADDEMDHGWVRVGPHENWYMTMETWLRLQELEVMGEVAVMLDALGPGMHLLPEDLRP